VQRKRAADNKDDTHPNNTENVNENKDANSDSNQTANNETDNNNNNNNNNRGIQDLDAALVARLRKEVELKVSQRVPL